MKKTKRSLRVLQVIILLLFSTGVSSAQQTLFDVPEAAAATKRKLYFQEQVYFNGTLKSSTTLFLGLGRGWEIGVNAFDVIVHTEPDTRMIRLQEDDPVNDPKLLLNAKKSIDLTSWWIVSAGGRAGGTLNTLSDNRFAAFSCLNSELCMGKTKVVGGVYYVTAEYIREMKNAYGIMGGFQLPVMKIFNVKADYISGVNNLSYITVGGGIFLPKQWEISTGVRLPSPGSHNPAAFTIQVSNR